MGKIVSFSLKEETLLKIEKRLKNGGSFRNKSHLVEYALERFLEEKEW